MALPLIALDVDGVLLPASTDLPDAHEHRVWENYRSFSLHHADYIASEAVLSFLLRMEAESLAQVRYHTSWRQTAAPAFAEHLGLPEWPMFPGSNYNKLIGWWKLLDIEDALAADPNLRVLWVDDDAKDAIDSGEISPELLSHPRLKIVHPRIRSGLSPEDLAVMELTLREWKTTSEE